jgi:hypothetical protein
LEFGVRDESRFSDRKLGGVRDSSDDDVWGLRKRGTKKPTKHPFLWSFRHRLWGERIDGNDGCAKKKR